MDIAITKRKRLSNSIFRSENIQPKINKTSILITTKTTSINRNIAVFNICVSEKS